MPPHAMQMDALRLLAMLSSSKGLTGHAVQMLLAGLPELSAALDSDGTPSLHGQAATRVALEPYSDLEARDFADHWLCRAGKAGSAPPVFQDDALREILGRGGGLPGALGSILDAVLKAARGRRRHVTRQIITRQMVCRALEPPSASATVPWHRLPAGKLPLLLVLAVLLAGVAATRMMEHQERPAAAADPPPGHAVNGSVAPAAEQLAGAAAVQPDQEAGAPQPAPPQPVKADTGNGGAAGIQPEAPLPVPVPPLAQNRQPVPSAVMRPVHQRAPGRISGAAHRKTTPPGVPSAASAPAKFRQHVGQPPGREAVHGLFPPSDTGG